MRLALVSIYQTDITYFFLLANNSIPICKTNPKTDSKTDPNPKKTLAPGIKRGKMSFWKMETSANRKFQETEAGKLTKLYYSKRKISSEIRSINKTLLTIGIIEI